MPNGLGLDVAQATAVAGDEEHPAEAGECGPVDARERSRSGSRVWAIRKETFELAREAIEEGESVAPAGIPLHSALHHCDPVVVREEEEYSDGPAAGEIDRWTMAQAIHRQVSVARQEITRRDVERQGEVGILPGLRHLSRG